MSVNLKLLCAIAIGIIAMSGCGAGEEQSRFSFDVEEIASDVEGAYLTQIADLNGDGRPDVILLSIRSSQVYWYENPTWEPHLFADGVSRAAVGAAVDSESGMAVLLTGFHRDDYAENKGELVAATAGGSSTVFAVEPAAHRAAFADVDGDDTSELVVAPISGPGADAPISSLADTPLVIYRPPDPTRYVVTESLKGTVHGLTIVDWDENGRDDIITAGFGGVWLHQSEGDDGLGSLAWRHRRLTAAKSSSEPRGRGAGDIRIGRTTDGDRFLATIETVHGDTVAVYVETEGGEWVRTVIGDGYKQLHGFAVADLDGDGGDEIIASDSREGGVFIFYRRTGAWEREILDADGMAAGACDGVDMTGDGLIDIVCAGLPTKNARLYVNRTDRQHDQ